MSSPKEKEDRRADEMWGPRIAALLDGGLRGMLRQTGYELRGLSFKMGEFDSLLVIKASSAEGPQVAFVGAGTPPLALLKAEKAVREGKLRWRADTWAGNPD